MIRATAANLCLLALMLGDGLIVGAAGMHPKPPSIGPSVFTSLPAPEEPLPPVAPSAGASSEVSTVNTPQSPTAIARQIGVASWYGAHWQGRVTASGKLFDKRKLTAAHRTLPLDTKVRVKNLLTGQSVEVTINDRGPYVDGRTIDLSQAAAEQLGMVKDGLVPVAISLVSLPPSAATKVADADPHSPRSDNAN
jgi:rare lipoprotein A